MAGGLSYHAVRLAACRRALLDGLRRWGVYAVVVVLLVGAGAAGAPAIVAGLAAWSVLPLFHGVTVSAPRGAAMTALYMLPGTALVWALRPLLLPRHWLEAERALPITARARRRSDARLVLLALLPLWGLQALGSAVLLGRNPPWLQGHRSTAVAALLLATAGALALSVALLQARRRPPRPQHRRLRRHATARSGPRPWPLVLLVLPLWRGPARRCGGLLLAGTWLLLLAPAALWRWPQGGGWWLAALAAAALVLASRLAVLVGEEVAPLIAAAATLPLRPSTLRRAAATLPLLPLLPALVALPAVLPAAARPGVLAAFVAAMLGAAALQAGPAPAAAETRAGRWLLCLVLLLALASEVLP